MQQTPRPDQTQVLRVLSQQSQRRVVHRRTEDGALALDVQAPSPVFVLLRVEIVADLDAHLVGDALARDVPCDDEAGEEEEGSAVFAGPVPRG